MGIGSTSATGDYSLRISSSDKATNLVVALLIVVVTAVACLFVLWLTSRIFVRRQAVPVILEAVSGRGEAPLGFAQDVDPPGVDELPTMLEPQLQETLATVSESARVATFAEETRDALESGQRAGRGDQRTATPLGPGTLSGIPRHQRWEISYASGNTLNGYARILDHFKIELGVIEPDGNVTYVGNLSARKPAVRKEPNQAERRLHFAWKQSPLQQADQELLRKAGVSAGNRVVLQFIPTDVENQLARIELQHAGGRPAEKIRRTVFGVKLRDKTHEFYVVRQSYL